MNGQLLADGALALVSIGLLWKGSDWVVLSAARIAHRMGVSDLVIGLTVVAVGTSAPEIVVSLVAAMRGQPDISVANVIGSNVFNLGFILGGCAALWTIPTSSHLVRRDMPMLLVAAAVLLFFLRDGVLGHWEGIAMMVILVGYVVILFRFDTSELTQVEEEVPHGVATWSDVPRLLAGLAGVLLGAHLLVQSAADLARVMGLSEWAIGMTIVAGGTSLPELACSFAAAARGHPAMVAGNLVGSDIHNVLGVLGIAAFLHPLHVSPAASSSVSLMIGMGLLLLLFMRSAWRVSRLEGCLLLAFALVRLSLDVLPELF